MPWALLLYAPIIVASYSFSVYYVLFFWKQISALWPYYWQHRLDQIASNKGRVCDPGPEARLRPWAASCHVCGRWPASEPGFAEQHSTSPQASLTNTTSPELGSLGTQAQTRAVAPLGAGLPRPGPVGLARTARYRVANTP